MLQGMRKHARYFYVLFVVVILSFIFWGVGSVDRQNGGKKEVQYLAEVGAEKVQLEDYWRTYDRMTEVYRETYKEKFDDKMRTALKAEVLESMIDNRVLLVAARAAGFTVSDEELQEAIMTDRSFTRNGAFSKEVYLRTLELNHLNPVRFEEQRREELLAAKIRRAVEDSVELSPYEKDTLVTSSTDPKLKDTILTELLDMKRQAALKSYVNGLKSGLKITVNKELIS